MLLHGIKTAWVFLKSTDGKTLLVKANGLSDNGLLELGHDVLGVASAEIKGLDGSKLEKISGNNTVQYSYADPLNPTVALTVNSIKMATYAKLVGLEKKGTGWQMADTKPVGGCVIKSPHMIDDGFTYFCFPSGNFLGGDKKLDSDSDSKKAPVTDTLNFAAIDDPNIDDLYRIYDTSDSDWQSEDAMFKEILPDYVKTTTVSGSQV